MHRADISSRLAAVMSAGNLAVADLAAWLNRPYATVRTWVFAERSPHGIYFKQIDARLRMLEHAVKTRTGFPIPEMSAHKRPEYIRQVRDAIERGAVVPTGDPAS